MFQFLTHQICNLQIQAKKLTTYISNIIVLIIKAIIVIRTNTMININLGSLTWNGCTKVSYGVGLLICHEINLRVGG